MKSSNKVSYTGCSKEQISWGSNDDPSTVLTMGDIYTIRKVEVHKWHTKIELREFPGKMFNSTCFDNVCPGCNKVVPRRGWCEDCDCCVFCCKAGDTIPTHIKIIVD